MQSSSKPNALPVAGASAPPLVVTAFVNVTVNGLAGAGGVDVGGSQVSPS